MGKVGGEKQKRGMKNLKFFHQGNGFATNTRFYSDAIPSKCQECSVFKKLLESLGIYPAKTIV